MSVGTGYEYLLASVARGDGATASSSPLTRYYAESGTPPGRFLGSGLLGLDDGRGVPEGTPVTEPMLFNLLGMLTDPITGRPLGGRPMRWPASQAERIRLRVAQLPADLTNAAQAAAIMTITAEETAREGSIRRPVAGFDLTFSVPKSVSVVWAVADAGTQQTIYHAHQDAIRVAIAWAEQHIFFSRSGRGGAVQEPIRGIVAAAFDHWDSRAGDPHLHTHVVVANRVQTLDGVWRTLDSKTIHQYVVALSELHEGVLQDLLTERLGYAWDERSRRHSRVPRHDIAGVPDELISMFSSRSADIEATTAALIAEFTTSRSRQPSTAEILQLRQQATLRTRPDKQQHPLSAQTASWRERAHPFAGADTAGWADALRNRSVLPILAAAQLDPTLLQQTARVALETVAAKRATFKHANVLAEMHRQLHGVRFATPLDRLVAADRMTGLALGEALLLTPPERAAVGAQLYTTREILDAESRLLDAARNTDGPAVPASALGVGPADPPSGRSLGADQVAAVHAVVTSGRVLDVLVGPAGTGKTTCLAELRIAWEAEHGKGSVVGLAPSSAAAEVLADELGIDTENTAKWLHEAARQNVRLDRIATLLDEINTLTSSPSTAVARRLNAELRAQLADHQRWMIRPGQLVIVDEAGLAGTLTLDRLVGEARDAGAKVLLVGDPAQLSAIEAGGAFAMLVNDRPDAPELANVRRFHNEWERQASLQLRAGNEAAIEVYAAHNRIHAGDRTQMLDAIHHAWRADTEAGLTSLMIASDSEAVAELNLRARADRVVTGEVDARCVDIAGGGVAGVGDRVVTRHNDRRLTTGRAWVKNGDAWTVQAVEGDGSLTVRRENGQARITLPPSYVHGHLELGYAATAFRAQARTVDTAHALIAASTTRESLYVSATRGRTANTIYVDTCDEPDLDTSHHTAPAASREVVLQQVLERSTADTSAHAALEREWERILAESRLQQIQLAAYGAPAPTHADATQSRSTAIHR